MVDVEGVGGAQVVLISGCAHILNLFVLQGLMDAVHHHKIWYRWLQPKTIPIEGNCLQVVHRVRLRQFRDKKSYLISLWSVDEGGRHPGH